MCKSNYSIKSLAMSELEELKLFENACVEGDLVVAKRIIAANPLDDTVGVFNSTMFDCACRCGNLLIVHWVLKLNPSVNYAHTFYVVCSWGYLCVARWMLKKAPNMIIPQDAFAYACLNGHLDVAKWLRLVNPVIFETKYLCECSYENGHVKVAEWLFQINPKAVFANSKYHSDAMLRWLATTRKMSLVA